MGYGLLLLLLLLDWNMEGVVIIIIVGGCYYWNIIEVKLMMKHQVRAWDIA